MADIPRSSRVARHARIADLISSHLINSQGELAQLLRSEGIRVSQGTLSRDLLEIGAVRVRDASGALVYAMPSKEIASAHEAHEVRLAQVCGELLVNANSSANLAICKTPPGAAQYFASVIDKVANPKIAGTIAGDDTIMVIASSPDGGAELAEWLTRMSNDGK